MYLDVSILIIHYIILFSFSFFCLSHVNWAWNHRKETEKKTKAHNLRAVIVHLLRFCTLDVAKMCFSIRLSFLPSSMSTFRRGKNPIKKDGHGKINETPKAGSLPGAFWSSTHRFTGAGLCWLVPNEVLLRCYSHPEWCSNISHKELTSGLKQGVQGFVAND